MEQDQSDIEKPDRPPLQPAKPASRPVKQFNERPTKEEIAALPLFASLPLDRIEVIKTPGQARDAVRAMKQERFVGFDTESQPTFSTEQKSTGPHVFQFALRERVYIFQSHLKHTLPFVKGIVESAHIVKIGFGLISDRRPLLRVHGMQLATTVDLTKELRSLNYKQALGVKAAVAVVLKHRLRKKKSITISSWSMPKLRNDQLLYAADDAFAALQIFRAIGSPYKPSTKAILRQERAKREEPIKVPLRKNRHLI